MKVRPISVTQSLIQIDGRTPSPEEMMAWVARVSSPQNQADLDTAPRLLRYCLKNGHWSVFESVHWCVEVETSRAIAAQILRHRSFCFQEFSQRYSDVSGLGYEPFTARRQDTKNRQASHDDLPEDTKDWFAMAGDKVALYAEGIYAEALKRGVAKECARMVLPLATTTRLYVTGNVRSWLTYIDTRTHESTQLEHRQVAEGVKAEFVKMFPVVAEAKWGGM